MRAVLRVLCFGLVLITGIVQPAPSWAQVMIPAMDRSVSETRKAAESGEAEAQFEMGKRYAYGEGVAQDYAQALLWYEKAVAQNHSGAIAALGILYEYGRGVPKNLDKAIPLASLPLPMPMILPRECQKIWKKPFFGTAPRPIKGLSKHNTRWVIFIARETRERRIL